MRPWCDTAATFCCLRPIKAGWYARNAVQCSCCHFERRPARWPTSKLYWTGDCRRNDLKSGWPESGRRRWRGGITKGLKRNHQRGPVIRSRWPSPTRLAHTKGNTQHIGSFDGQGVTPVQCRLQAFRQLRQIRTLNRSSRIVDVAPIHGVPRQTNQLPKSLIEVERATDQTKRCFRFSVKIYTLELKKTRLQWQKPLYAATATATSSTLGQVQIRLRSP